MSTDIAEFLGAALGLNLLFGVPLLTAGLITGVIAFGILELQRRGFRRFELAITALLGIIFAGFLYETLRIGPSAHDSLRGLLPGLSGTGSLYLAVGIIGATVMPHVIYLHSALTNGRMPVRNDARAPAGAAVRAPRRDHRARARRARQHGDAGGGREAVPHPGAVGAEHDPAALTPSSGAWSAVARRWRSRSRCSPRAHRRRASARYAGQVVMAGFVNIRIPLLVRRAVTMVPALVVLAVGVSPTSALVLSQVVLSFGIPFALIPLVMLTSNREVMGVHVNRRADDAARLGVRAADHGAERVPDPPAVRRLSTLAARWRSPTPSSRSSTRCPTTGPTSSSTCGSSTSAATSTRRCCSSPATRSRTRRTTGTGGCWSPTGSATRPRCRRSTPR